MSSVLLDPRDPGLARRWERAELERHALTRVARRRGLSPEDADDCVQDAILRVVLRSDLDEDRMGALLTTTVSRLAIDVHRRRASERKATARVAVVERVHDFDGPEARVCDRAEARWSASVVEQLPQSQRRALAARAEGQAWDDIARDMSLSLKAVESVVSRARTAMRAAIASTWAILIGLARRMREKSPDVAAFGTAAVLVMAAPMIDGDPAGGGVGVAVGAPTRAPSPRAEPPPAHEPRQGAEAAPPQRAHASPRPAPGPAANQAKPRDIKTLAEINTPVHDGRVTVEEKEEDDLTRTRKCVEGGYRLTVNIDKVDDPRVDGRCEYEYNQKEKK